MAATINTNAQSAACDALGTPHVPLNRTSSGQWNEVEVTPPVLSPVTVVFPAAAVEDHITIVPSTDVSELETLQEGSDTGNGPKKSAWNRPSNGAPDTGRVMGAVSWPTLFESTKTSTKLLSIDSPKNPSDTTLSAPQVSSAPVYTSPGSSSAPQRPIISNPNSPNTPPHRGRPARQKSMKRESGGNLSSNSVLFNQHPQSSSMGDASHDSSGSTKISSGGSDDSPRGHNSSYRDGGQRGGGDHPQQRNYRSNNSPHFRGDGSLGGRRDQDQGNHEWNHHRNFNGRDPVGPPQRGGGPRGYVRTPPPGAASYIPPPTWPYGMPIGVPPEMRSLYFLAPQPGMPFIAQMPPALYFPPDPQLHAKVINQIEYYFSNENLIRDTFLRGNMDKNGWVPVQLVAGFTKVKQLTTDVQLILDALRASTVVEIQGDRIRKIDDWMRWMMPPSVHFSAASGSQSPSTDRVAADLQDLMVEEKSHSQSTSTVQVDVQAMGQTDIQELNK